MHEATRKMLGVLLREMDGFDSVKKSIVIGAFIAITFIAAELMTS